MDPTPLEAKLPVLAIGKRLALLLIGFAAYCVAVHFAIRYWNILPLNLASEVTLINSVILGLLLSFRNQVAYGRWWEGRRLWGDLTNHCRNLACKFAAFLPAEVLLRSRAAALLTGFPDALNRHLRGETLRLSDLQGFEKEKAEPAHLPLFLAGRLYAVVADWKREGHVDEALLRILDPHLRGFLDVCGGCERIRNTPLSPSYISLMRTGLALNVLVSPWFTLAELGLWGLPVLLLVCFFLFGVELIDTIVEEPFGRKRDELDLDRYCRTIRDSVRSSLPETAQLN